MAILQFLGLVIPALILLSIFMWSIKECNKGNEKKLVPTWIGVVTLLSCLIFGFTMGTLVS